MIKFLIIDDDVNFCEALSNSLNRGKDEISKYDIKLAHDAAMALKIATEFMPQLILMDLKIPGVSGLELIPRLLKINLQSKIVVLTGYANITTAIEAIKLGAVHYLSKPVSSVEIIAAFNKQQGDPKTPIELSGLKLSDAEREYIASVFERNWRNVSATARELGIHRRTLQRKLDKLRLN